MLWTKQRRAVIDTLASVPGGEIADPKSGRATGILRDLVGYDGSPTGFSQLMNGLAGEICECGEHFVVDRDLNSKRVYRITLAPCFPRSEQPPTEPEEITEEPEHPVALEVDYDRLALTVVEALVDTLAPRVMDPELQKRLASIHEHARNLEAKLGRMKANLAAAADELQAKNTTIAGLRERLRAAEANIERLKTAAKDGWTDYDQAIDRFMRETPHASVGRD